MKHLQRLFPIALLSVGAALHSEDAIPTQDLTLAAAHALALRNQPRLAIAQLQAEIAAETTKAARAGFFPTVNAYVTGVEAGNENTRILAGGLNNPSIYDRVGEGLVVNQLITDFGHSSNLVAGSKLHARAEAQNAAATKEQILLNVDLAYFNTLQAEAIERVARQTLSTRQLIVKRVTALSANELRSGLDVSFAQVSLEEAQLLLQKAEGAEGIAQANLGAALGYHEPRQFRLEDTSAAALPPAEYSSLISAALRGHPEILRLQYERDAARRFAQAEKDVSYPTVTAVGTIGDSPDHDAHLPEHYAAGGITLSLPLFTGGLDSARRHAAVMKSQIAEQTLRDAEDNVIRDVRIAWLNFKTAAKRLSTTELLLKHATEAFDLTQARYKLGSNSIVELSQAQLEETSAQIEHAGALYDTLIQRSILEFQTGTLH